MIISIIKIRATARIVLHIFLFAFCLCWLAPEGRSETEQAGAIEAQQHLARAKALLTRGDAARANVEVEIAVAQVGRIWGHNAPEYATALETRAEIRIAVRASAEASRDLADATTTWQQILGEHPALRFAYRRIAKLYQALAAFQPNSDAAARAAALLSKANEFDAQADAQEAQTVIVTKGQKGPERTPYAKMEIFYGTTRKPTGATDPTNYYGFQRGDLKFGRMIVSVPQDHELGEIEAPHWYLLEWAPSPDRHIFIWGPPKPLARTDFVNALRTRVTGSRRKEAFVFIHGYNTSFAEAALRTAQMAFDLEVDGPSIFYSWPSRGGTFDYIADSNECGAEGIGQLTDFLTTVARQSGATKVNVLAHSLGNCFLVQSMQQFAQQHPANPLSEVVMAAPDYDPGDFRVLLPSIRRATRQLTLYASSRDYALAASRDVRGRPRVGDAAVRFADPNIDSIDASDVPAPDIVGHSYFAGGALGDLRAVLWHGLKPEARCVLTRLSESGMTRWHLSTTSCDDRAFRMAVLLLRRKGSIPAALEEAQRQRAQYQQAGDAAAANLFAATIAQLPRLTN